MSDTDLLKTPLHALHLELGARMVPFAGYAMPVQYPAGLIAEHRHTRAAASLFDVSHMGQLELIGPQAAPALETLIPADALSLAPDHQRYGLLLSETGTIMDDFMFVNRGDRLFLIVNGACKQADIAHITARIGSRCEVRPMPGHGLLALQGPHSADVLSRLLPGVGKLVFMTGAAFDWEGAALYVTRSGYTGEDGFEISAPADRVEDLARRLLTDPRVKPAGLGARNSLRLEAGLCLYGNDLDLTTTPIEAGLNWAIQKVRRTGGQRAGGFPGAARVLAQLDGSEPVTRRRVGLIAGQRVPVREPAELHDAEGRRIGQVTSGLLGPTLDRPIAIAYVTPEHAARDTQVSAIVRGKEIPMTVAATPFVPTRYYRG